MPLLNAVVYTLLVLAILVMCFPIAWMLSISFRPNVEVMKIPPDWLPQVFTLLYLWEKAADVMPWIDLNRASAMLGSGTNGGAPLTNTDWAHIASAYGLWVALPIVLGTWMLLRREVK